MPDIKKCGMCAHVLPVEMFFRRYRGNDTYRQSRCADCHRETQAQRLAANRSAIYAANKKRASTPEQRAKRNAYKRAYRAAQRAEQRVAA